MANAVGNESTPGNGGAGGAGKSLSAPATARLLGVHRSTVLRWASEGRYGLWPNGYVGDRPLFTTAQVARAKKLLGADLERESAGDRPKGKPKGYKRGQQAAAAPVA